MEKGEARNGIARLRSCARRAIVLVAAACTGTGGTPAKPAEGVSPMVVSCCGASDSLIMAQMQRYESTPASQRTADIAIAPFRTTSGMLQRERVVVHDRATW